MSAREILDADMTTIGGWIAAGARAWVEELRGLVPAGWHGALSPRQAMLRFDPASGTLRASDAARIGRGSRAAILIPRDLCLLRTLELPSLRRRDLAKLLMLDRERIMPFTGEGSVVAGRVLEPGLVAGRTLVEVAGVPAARARAIVEAIVGAGVAPVRVAVKTVPGDARPAIDLLPALREAGLIGKARGNAGRWWAVVAFLFTVNLGMSIWRDVAAFDRLQQIVDAQQPALFAARSISARIDRAGRIAGTVRAKRRKGEPLALLGMVGASLPAGAWVQRFAWEGDTLRLAGYRPVDADVLGALRKAAGVREVRGNGAEEVAAVPAGRPFDVTISLRPR